MPWGVTPALFTRKLKCFIRLLCKGELSLDLAGLLARSPFNPSHPAIRNSGYIKQFMVFRL